MHVCTYVYVCMSACRVAAKLSLSHAFCVLPYVLLPLQATVSFAALLLLFLLLLLLRVIVHVVICIGQTAVEQPSFAQWNKLEENVEYKTEKYIQIRLFGFLLT